MAPKRFNAWATPATVVPTTSVAIDNSQTCVYNDAMVRHLEQQRSIARSTLSVAHRRMQQAYAAIPEVAIRVIEECRDVMELDFAVKAWREAKTDYERIERDQREAGLFDG